MLYQKFQTHREIVRVHGDRRTNTHMRWPRHNDDDDDDFFPFCVFFHSFPFFDHVRACQPAYVMALRQTEIESPSECMYWYSARTLWWSNMDIHLLIYSRAPLSLSHIIFVSAAQIADFVKIYINVCTVYKFLLVACLPACLFVSFPNYV